MISRVSFVLILVFSCSVFAERGPRSPEFFKDMQDLRQELRKPHTDLEKERLNAAFTDKHRVVLAPEQSEEEQLAISERWHKRMSELKASKKFYYQERRNGELVEEYRPPVQAMPPHTPPTTDKLSEQLVEELTRMKPGIVYGSEITPEDFARLVVESKGDEKIFRKAIAKLSKERLRED